MKNLIVKAIILLLMPSLCFADGISNPPLNIEEEDASPSTFPYKLKVSNGTLTDNGDGTASLSSGGGGSTSFSGTSPAGILYINTGNTATASTLNIIDANGNVGIGYTLPVGTLQVGTSPTPGLIVTAAGNVGIGTTAPNAPLTLKAITNGKTVFRIQESDSTTAAFQISVSPTGASLSGLNSGGQVFQISSSDSTNTFFYNAANTGIGTNSPRAMFQVGTSPIAGLVVTSSENVGIGTTSPLGLLQVGTSPFPGLMVTTAGNTGVGTTNPYQELTVIGDQTISDDTPNLTFRDSTDDVAYQWHLDTAAAAAPNNNFVLFRGTDSGAGFSVTQELMRFNNDNAVYFPNDLIHKFTRCMNIDDLTSADDNISLGMWSNNVTITAIGCSYIGTGTTTATLTLEDGSGNAMTIAGTNPVCVAHGTDATFTPVTAGNTLNAGEILRFDVTNTPSPTSDDMTICIEYTE